MPRLMTFGVHKGKPLSEVPTDYLKWAVGKLDDRKKLLPIEAELCRRMESSRPNGETRQDKSIRHFDPLPESEPVNATRVTPAIAEAAIVEDADDPDGTTHKCNRCGVPMVAVAIAVDWCRGCGSVWLKHIRTFNSPDSGGQVSKGKKRKSAPKSAQGGNG